MGTTHAAFTDASLILPAYINRRTGLRVDPAKFWGVCIDAVSAFLSGAEGRAYVREQAKGVGALGEGGGEEGRGEGSESGGRKRREEEVQDGAEREGKGLELGTFVVHDL